jgi:CYTH domain-containing protein
MNGMVDVGSRKKLTSSVLLSEQGGIMARRQVEIERKWLLKETPDMTRAKESSIIQGYVAVASDGTEVRLRQDGDKYFETVKAGKGLRRAEHEIELTRNQFKSLWPVTRGRRLEKVRYKVKWRGVTIEVDIYRKKRAGLKVAEVEFKSRKQATKFTPPHWFGKEITHVASYRNVNLAG